MFSSFYKKKRAQEGMSISTILGLALAAIAILLLSYIAVTVIGIFSKSNQELDSTLHNFDELTYMVQKLVKNNDEEAEIHRFPLYTYSGYTIIGFDRFQNYIMTYHGSKLYKPSNCRNKACLCLYYKAPFYGQEKYDDESTKDKGVVKCTTYSENIKFISHYRRNEWGHADTIGEKRDDITLRSTDGFEYFIATGRDSTFNILTKHFLNNVWNIKNMELKKTVYFKDTLIEISTVPDAEELHRQKIREEAAKLLDTFLSTQLAQNINDLTKHTIEGPVVAKEFLEQHPEVYQGKSYQEFITALYHIDESISIKGSVFTSVSYSMFKDEIPTDSDGMPVIARIFVDYPPPEAEGFGDYYADLGISGTTQPELVIGKEVEIERSDVAGSEPLEAQVNFFISDFYD